MKSTPHRHSTTASDPATALLLANGVRATGARSQVLMVLLDSKRALSHLEVQSALPEMDRVTLYRALDCLTDAGIAHKISGDDRVFRYSTGSESTSGGSVAGAQHAHAHFKCTRCTRVFCLDDERHPELLYQQWQTRLQAALGPGFQSQEIELTIKGWCAECAA
ncbi:Fur family transcriptional regulator [Undibacterium sp. MH2W]|uniref:Fur family transcriptional regulator n=1 Tax=Undibacterium sp. MH2W TaxID=3413044 RepID=UPI003BF318CB